MSATLAEPTAWGIKNLAPFPARHADSPQRIAWLRGHVRGYAWWLACLDLAGEAVEWIDGHGGPPSAKAELLLAATRMAQHAAIPFADGYAAGQAEWDAAQSRAREFVDQLRHTVYPLARDRASGEIILAAARRVNDRFDCALPSPLIEQACRVIAASAQPQRHTRRRR
jgi:hypothetical protein